MSKKERKLTAKEIERKVNYKKFCEKIEKNGYIKQELTVGILLVNVAAIIIMLPFIALIAWVNSAVNSIGNVRFSLSTSIIFLIFFLILVILHEVIHGLTWGIFAQNHFHSITFGIIWEVLTPYCTCSEPLKKWQYILGALMPTLILGFGMAAISIVFRQQLLFVLSELMVLSGGGDFFIVLKMLLYSPKGNDVLYYDHPYECGVVAFEKIKP